MKIVAALQDPELEWLKIGLREMGIRSVSIREFLTDLEALQTVYLEGRPDFLVMDLDLPGVIGLETVRAIRQQQELALLPLILLSNKDLAVGPKAAPRTQALVKPVHPDAWAGAIRLGLSAPPPPAEPEAQDPPPPADPLPDRDEFRKAARKPCETPCLVVVPGKKVKGVLRDVSMTGARIALSAELAGASMVHFLFGVPGTVPLKIAQFKARLVRRTSDGYAIAFREMDPDTRGCLLALTSK